MIHCHQVDRQTPADASQDDTITLDETERHRRRIRMTSDNGIEFLLELEAAVLLRENDILPLSDGRTIRVLAKPEALYEVRGNDAMHLLHLTWHVGNRHLPTQIMADHFRIRRDSVIQSMLTDLGAVVTEIQAGFNPLSGAYGNAHAGSSAHEHSHSHSHASAETHSHAHSHSHSHDDHQHGL